MARITVKKILKFTTLFLFIHLLLKIILGIANTHTNADIGYVSFSLLLSKIYYHVKWTVGINKRNIDETDVNSYPFKKYSNQNEEWELLDNNVYISRHLSFYFIDERTISSVIISRFGLVPNIFCLIHVKENNKVTNAVLVKSNLLELEIQQSTTFYKIECRIPENVNFKVKNSKLSLYLIYKHFLFFNSIILTMERTERPIILQMKTKYNMNFFKNSSEYRIALCGPFLYLKSKTYDQLKLWLDINIKIGYKKIILYLISVENSEKFNRLFEEYKDFVEIRYYQNIPNVFYLREKHSSPYINAGDYTKALQNAISKNKFEFYFKEIELHWVHHRAIINGCFMSCFKDYERVSIIDTDELIIPLSAEARNLFYDRTSRVKADNIYFRTQLEKVKCNYDINKYINSLNQIHLNTNYTPNISLWMQYSHYLDSSTVKNIFRNLKIKASHIQKFQKSLNITIYDMGNLTFSVNNEGEFNYLKNLISFYDNVYLSGETLIRLEDRGLNRIWSVQDTGSGKA